MKRQIAAFLVGIILANAGSILHVSAATTVQKANPVPSSFSERSLSDLGGETNSSSKQLCSAQLLKHAQKLCARRPIREGRVGEGDDSE